MFWSTYQAVKFTNDPNSQGLFARADSALIGEDTHSVNISLLQLAEYSPAHLIEQPASLPANIYGDAYYMSDLNVVRYISDLHPERPNHGIVLNGYDQDNGMNIMEIMPAMIILRPGIMIDIPV
jgi:hypothetical protein